MPRKINEADYIGKTYNRLTILEFIENEKSQKKVICECECKTVKEYLFNHVKDGHTKSCGCLKSEATKKMSETHGLHNTRLYNIFKCMKRRCYNSKSNVYKHYGGRGITICDEWLDSFQAFYDWSIKNGYADNLTIERMDNDKGYFPDNCKWATMTEQGRNKRNPSNNTSGVRGVNFIKNTNKWRASITNNYEVILIGEYESFEEATKARKQAEQKYWYGNNEIDIIKPIKYTNTKSNTSGVRGVIYRKDNKKWYAYITNNGKRIHLGAYDTIDNAAYARKQGELKYWG